MTDRSGKKLQVGSLVDIHLNGMYTAKIVEIHEKPMAVSRNQMVPPQFVAIVSIQHVPSDSRTCGCYLIADPEPAIVGSVQ